MCFQRKWHPHKLHTFCQRDSNIDILFVSENILETHTKDWTARGSNLSCLFLRVWTKHTHLKIFGGKSNSYFSGQKIENGILLSKIEERILLIKWQTVRIASA